MKVTYDPEADAAFIHLGDAEPVDDEIAETTEAAPNVMLDRDAAGNIAGIEILHAGGLATETLMRRAAEAA